MVVLNAVCVVAKSIIRKKASGRMMAYENSSMNTELARAQTSTILPLGNTKPKDAMNSAISSPPKPLIARK